MSTPDWRQISNPAKAVVRGLLTLNPDQRMGMQELRAHPWLERPLEQLVSESAHLAALDGGGTVEPDANLIGALNYLTRCIDTNAEAAYTTDGLVLHVSGGSADSRSKGPAVVTVMVENGGVWVAPGAQLEQPLAMVALSRAQCLRWLSGDAQLVSGLPSHCMLRDFLAIFLPTSAGFMDFCREQRVVPTAGGRALAPKAAKAPAGPPHARPHSAGPPGGGMPQRGRGPPPPTVMASGPPRMMPPHAHHPSQVHHHPRGPPPPGGSGHFSPPGAGYGGPRAPPPPAFGGAPPSFGGPRGPPSFGGPNAHHQHPAAPLPPPPGQHGYGGPRGPPPPQQRSPPPQQGYRAPPPQSHSQHHHQPPPRQLPPHQQAPPAYNPSHYHHQPAQPTGAYNSQHARSNSGGSSTYNPHEYATNPPPATTLPHKRPPPGPQHARSLSGGSSTPQHARSLSGGSTYAFGGGGGGSGEFQGRYGNYAPSSARRQEQPADDLQSL